MKSDPQSESAGLMIDKPNPTAIELAADSICQGKGD